jgi:hypothetical protein
VVVLHQALEHGLNLPRWLACGRMRAIDAQDHMLALLRGREVELTEVDGDHVGDGRDAPAAWEAFVATARVPAYEPFTAHGETRRVSPDPDHDGDLLLFESGRESRRPDKGWSSLSDAAEPKVFSVSFTRQFSFEDDDGEYLGMNGLRLTIEFDCDLDRQAQRWGNAAADVDVWRHAVEQDSAFAEAFAGEAQRFYFGQGDY